MRAKTRAPVLCLLACLSFATAARGEPAKLVVAGDEPRNGIFDPSLAYEASGAQGWLAYSAVFGTLNPWGPHVETHLAKTLDGGHTWTFVRVVNPSEPGSVTLPDQTVVSGVWNYEVASLVHDPDDPGREWKLFAHRIFRRADDNVVGNQNLPEYSWIAFRYASDPAGPWSDDVALFGSGPLPAAPYNHVQVAVSLLHPSLSSLIVYTEPGALYSNGVLYVSLSGLLPSGVDRIVLLASDDHGRTWRYAGTPLTNADAALLGYRSFDGSAIAADSGRVFLLVTPATDTVAHDGTLVFELADLASGTLLRTASSIPLVRKYVPPQAAFLSQRGGGQSAYHARNLDGVLMPQINLADSPELFQIFHTGQGLATCNGDGCPLPLDIRQCQDATGRAGRAYVSQRLRALQSCRDSLNRGRSLFLDAAETVPLNDPADCAAELETAATIAKARASLRQQIERRCAASQLALLSACGGTVDGLVNATGSGGCLVATHDAAVESMLDSQYGRRLAPEEESARQCQHAMATAARRYASTRHKDIERCRSLLAHGKAQYLDAERASRVIELSDCAREFRASVRTLTAGRKLRDAIARRGSEKCNDADVASLVLACANTVDGLVSADGAAGCLLDRATQAVGALIEAEY